VGTIVHQQIARSWSHDATPTRAVAEAEFPISISVLRLSDHGDDLIDNEPTHRHWRRRPVAATPTAIA
jgi:hypothetical protein